MTQELDSVFEMLERGLNSGKLDGENQRKGGKNGGKGQKGWKRDDKKGLL